jgi:hypothetical protein
MADEAQKRPVIVGRKDLHRQVWETPITRLAADYGISGNGLAKICDRMKIPYPPRGYWAKKVASKKVVEYQLPEPDAGDSAGGDDQPDTCTGSDSRAPYRMT